MADLNRGYVKLFRAVDQNPIWTQLAPAVFKLFVACLLKAERDPVSWFDGLRQVELPPGSFLTCLADMIEFSYLTRKQVRDGFDGLVRLRIIEKRAHSGAHSKMGITLVNWHTYQTMRETPGHIVGQDRGTFGAHSGVPSPAGKEVFLSTPTPVGTRIQETNTTRAREVSAYDPGPGWEVFARRFPSIRKLDLANRMWNSMCKSSEDEAAILAGVERYCASDEVARGVVTSAENWLRDRIWEGKFTPAKATKGDALSQQIGTWKAKT